MEHVVLVIHLMFTLALIGLILIQRSEGGGLGLGTGGGMGSFASAQSTKNVITKITTIVAACFFTTSLILAIMASHTDRSKSILDLATPAVESPAATTTQTTTPITPTAPVPALGGSTAAPTPTNKIPTPQPTTTPKVPLGQ
jgi:preprotein translocase subunit SecG